MNPIGFVSNVYAWNGITQLDAVIERAVTLGFDAIEIGPTFAANEKTVRSVTDAGLAVSNFIYCRNLLSPDSGEADIHVRAVRERIHAACDLGIGLVVLCGGYANPCADLAAKDSYATIRTPPVDNLDPFLRVYGPLLNDSEKHGVRIAFEHCPLMGNWLISPPLWAAAFDAIGSDYVGLCFDPSHLVWQFIDAYDAFDQFAHRVFHIHAKDTEIYRDRLSQRGILTDFAWWENRLPGFGELNWTRMADAIIRSGYTGTISIEHEDPVWTGSPERVDSGLTAARDHLLRCWQAAAGYRPEDDSTARIARPDGA
ncbi:MAG: sugar phosphate isomerase/epimerase [Spirochaetaceae bacterium]|nr:MAG: sugar phosphate isomerase/epimerase [Spirochaetaceae bacterium]